MRERSQRIGSPGPVIDTRRRSRSRCGFGVRSRYWVTRQMALPLLGSIDAAIEIWRVLPVESLTEARQVAAELEVATQLTELTVIELSPRLV